MAGLTLGVTAPLWSSVGGRRHAHRTVALPPVVGHGSLPSEAQALLLGGERITRNQFHPAQKNGPHVMNIFASRRRAVFGSNLGESWATFPNIPQVVIACAEVIDAHGDTEGLFSTPGCRGIARKGERKGVCVHLCVCVWWDEACARSRPPCTGMTERTVVICRGEEVFEQSGGCC
jgi:hypothetical protein